MAEEDGAPVSPGALCASAGRTRTRVPAGEALVRRNASLPRSARRRSPRIAPALEIIDSRFDNFKFTLGTWLPTTASSSGYVIGPWRKPDARASPTSALVMSIRRRRRRQVGTTAGILGNPLALARGRGAPRSAAAGEPLQAGWIVMAGGATAAEPLNPANTSSWKCRGSVASSSTQPHEEPMPLIQVTMIEGRSAEARRH